MGRATVGHSLSRSRLLSCLRPPKERTFPRLGRLSSDHEEKKFSSRYVGNLLVHFHAARDSVALQGFFNATCRPVCVPWLVEIQSSTAQQHENH